MRALGMCLGLFLVLVAWMCSSQIVIAQDVAATAASVVAVPAAGPDLGLWGRLVGFIPANVVAWVLAVFALLNALSTFLTWIADMTKNATANKAAHILADVLKFLSWLINLITANNKRPAVVVPNGNGATNGSQPPASSPSS